MNQRDAMKMALEALEYAQSLDIPHLDEHLDALDNLRTALAEPEQEPVAWRYELATAIFESGEYTGWRCTISEKEPCAPENSIRNLQPLYTHPPQRKPLSDEEIWREYQGLWPFHPAAEPKLAADIAAFARAIERAHGIGGEA